MLSLAVRYGPAYRRAPFLFGVWGDIDFGLSLPCFGVVAIPIGIRLAIFSGDWDPRKRLNSKTLETEEKKER